MERPERAAAILRALCAGVSPTGGPIPARLHSPDPFARSRAELLTDPSRAHADLLAIVAAGDDNTPLVARAPSRSRSWCMLDQLRPNERHYPDGADHPSAFRRTRALVA
jgi:hypothetical protein